MLVLLLEEAHVFWVLLGLELELELGLLLVRAKPLDLMHLSAGRTESWLL